MTVKEVITTGKRPVYVWTDELEDTARQQLENVSQLPFIHKHVAAMPDVHAGMGATIGSVIATKNAVIPAAVGVDIGCGMRAEKLKLWGEDSPATNKHIRGAIEHYVPHGRTDNGGKNDKGAWNRIPDNVAAIWKKIDIRTQLPEVIERHPGLLKGHVNDERHLGTLGTGNHFIELCLDESAQLWLVVHSGSRGIGNRIGSYFTKLARARMDQWFVTLPDPNLAYLPRGTQDYDDYMKAVNWAQRYAFLNRQIMAENAMNGIMEALLARGITNEAGIEVEQVIDCHHNYAATENHFNSNVLVTRKGAIRARAGDFGIVPGSMGARSYIVRGLGCAASFHSCAHGAGRAMSRTQARRSFTEDDLRAQTAGIECRKDTGVLDEIPGAYKDIDTVMENQADLVEVVHTLRQIVNVKG